LIYEPAEDSQLIKEQIKDYAQGLVLDMGTGSGILAKEAEKYCDKVIAVDIQEEVIAQLKKQKNNNKITYKVSDLFSNIKEKFDLIIFNPPYLPNDPALKDLTLDGGKQGYEIIEKFLKKARSHLKKDGKILLLFSSLTKKKKVEELINQNQFQYKEVAKKKLNFEELYVYLLKWK